MPETQSNGTLYVPDFEVEDESEEEFRIWAKTVRDDLTRYLNGKTCQIEYPTLREIEARGQDA